MSSRSISLEWVFAWLLGLGAILVIVGQVAESKVLQFIGGLMLLPFFVVLPAVLVGGVLILGLRSVFRRRTAGTDGASTSVDNSARGPSAHDKDSRQ
jgi:hypothetical protein